MYLTSMTSRGKLYVSDLRVYTTVAALRNRLEVICDGSYIFRYGSYVSLAEWIKHAPLRVYEVEPDSDANPVLIHRKRLATLVCGEEKAGEEIRLISAETGEKT